MRNQLILINSILLKKMIAITLVIVALVLSACQPVDENTEHSALQSVSGKPVLKGQSLTFPKDHGVHPEQGIDWWYITANLTSESGETFGVQWTLFRQLMPSDIKSTWWDNNIYFAHFALQHQQKHVAFERFARAEQAKITSSPFVAKIDHWQLASQNNSMVQAGTSMLQERRSALQKSKTKAFLPLSLRAKQDDYQVDLTLSDSPRVLHGEQGYSQKTASGHASYYFSYPFLSVQGQLIFAGKSYQVTGNAWYDREWSASLLDRHQRGWDWFSLVAESSSTGHKQGLMLFCIRGSKQDYDYCRGSEIAADGVVSTLDHQDIELSVLATTRLEQAIYPSKWQLKLKDKPAIIVNSITKDSRNQLIIPYWEGRVKASGGFNGKGYAELTGYE